MSLSNLSCKGFTTNAWLTGLLALLVVPLFLTASAKILTFFYLPEKRPFPYPWTVFTYLNAFAQKVPSFIKQDKVQTMPLRIKLWLCPNFAYYDAFTKF